MPQVLHFLELEGEATEPTIRRNIPARGIFVSKAIKELFKRDTVGRNGQGRKGDPFKYHVLPRLDCNSGGIRKGGEFPGLEFEMHRTTLAGERNILVPIVRDMNGPAPARIQSGIDSGLESEQTWEVVPR